MIDLLHAYMLYDKGEMPLDLNRDNFYYRVFTVGLDAILTGASAYFLYQANPALAIAGLSTRSITVISGVFGGVVTATANYLNRRIDRFRPLSGVKIVAARVLTLASSLTLFYQITKIAGAFFGIQFHHRNLILPYLTSTVIGPLAIFLKCVELRYELLAIYTATQTYRMLKQANRASMAFSPAMPIDSTV